MPLCLIKGVPFVVVDHSDTSIISGLVFDKKIWYTQKIGIITKLRKKAGQIRLVIYTVPDLKVWNNWWVSRFLCVRVVWTKSFFSVLARGPLGIVLWNHLTIKQRCFLSLYKRDTKKKVSFPIRNQTSDPQIGLEGSFLNSHSNNGCSTLQYKCLIKCRKWYRSKSSFQSQDLIVYSPL